MNCPKCNASIPEGSKFCVNCGENITTQQTGTQANYQQQAGANQNFSQKAEGFFNPNDYGPNNGHVEFTEAIKLFLKNSFNFKGRASKSEFWWGFLFNFIASLVLGFIPFIGYIASVALAIPGISNQIRRLHDVGKPWTYYLLNFIPCGIGSIILIVMFYIKDSDGDNNWGPASR